MGSGDEIQKQYCDCALYKDASRYVDTLGMVFCLQTFAGELSMDIQKACVYEQLSEHKGIKGRPLEESDFNEYCKCEADYILKKATKEQLNQISKDQSKKPKWLQKLKSSALIGS